MTGFNLNQETCIKCGLCVEDCPTRVLNMKSEGPSMMNEERCVGCGHCVAVCPKAAIEVPKAPLSGQKQVTGEGRLSASAAEEFLRMRRSIRLYKDEQVSREKLLKLLDVARFAPTGGNTQGLHYLVVEDRDVMHRISNVVIEFLREQGKRVSWLKGYAGMADEMKAAGEDMILRNAPHLILATAAQGMPMGRDNSRFSLAYAELYAPTLGLGTCWAGFLEMCLNAKHQPLLELLGVPEGRDAVGAIMVGYPRVSYHRLVDRNPLSVAWR